MYDGFWASGKRHGIGLCRNDQPPAVAPHAPRASPPATRQSGPRSASAEIASAKDSRSSSAQASPSLPQRMNSSLLSLIGSVRGGGSPDKSLKRGATAIDIALGPPDAEGSQTKAPPARMLSTLLSPVAAMLGSEETVSDNKSRYASLKKAHIPERSCGSYSIESSAKDKLDVPSRLGHSGEIGDFASEAQERGAARKNALLQSIPDAASGAAFAFGGGSRGGGRIAALCHFESDAIVAETPLPCDEADALMRQWRPRSRLARGATRASLLDVKGVGFKLGKTVNEGHQSYNLMLALQVPGGLEPLLSYRSRYPTPSLTPTLVLLSAAQLGLKYSVSRISSQPNRKEMSPIEFQLKARD